MCYARRIGKERAEAEAAEARLEGLTADEVRAAAAAEGLVLVPSSTNETGFKHVTKDKGRYTAGFRENGKFHDLGSAKTPEGAALCYARRIGKERAAAEAAEAMIYRQSPTTQTINETVDTKISRQHERRHKKPSKYEDFL